MKKLDFVIVNGKKLKPLSEYQGPVLKLTKKEKTEIAKLETQIAQLRCDLYDVEKKRGTGRIPWAKEDFFIKLKDDIYYKIEKLQNIITEIKTNRLNKQKAKLDKKV